MKLQFPSEVEMQMPAIFKNNYARSAKRGGGGEDNMIDLNYNLPLRSKMQMADIKGKISKKRRERAMGGKHD